MLIESADYFNMSELAPFITGMLVGLAAAIFVKGKGKQLPLQVSNTKKLLNTFIKGQGDYKMVFVVRNDLGMTKGKVATQCAHASLLCYKIAMENCPESVKLWSISGQAKIALKLDGKGEQEILKLAEKANELGVVNTLIRDAGRTQIERGTITVLGLGPSPSKVIDQISGHLKLL
ncbi:uncharacterized protein LOC142319335 [Lycorma delicatula]|uniref:uncharacterized protein LOC142319335 n=1 Tax=Lycorma delicatula TaxID=130591 RepID=UPI003F517F02